MTGAENAIRISKEIAKICDSQPMEDVMTAFSLALGYAVEGEDPQDGMKVLMLVLSQAAEFAFDITTEIITPDQIQ